MYQTQQNSLQNQQYNYSQNFQQTQPQAGYQSASQSEFGKSIAEASAGKEMPDILGYIFHYFSTLNGGLEDLFSVKPDDPSVLALKEKVDHFTGTGEHPIYTVNYTVVAALLCYYFQCLPQPLIPPKCFDLFIQISHVKPQVERARLLRVFFALLPSVTRKICVKLFLFLNSAHLPPNYYVHLFADFIARPSLTYNGSAPNQDTMNAINQCVEQASYISMDSESAVITEPDGGQGVSNFSISIQAKFDFTASDTSMIALKANDIATVNYAYVNDWLEITFNGATGYFPSSYATLVETPNGQSTQSSNPSFQQFGSQSQQFGSQPQQFGSQPQQFGSQHQQFGTSQAPQQFGAQASQTQQFGTTQASQTQQFGTTQASQTQQFGSNGFNNQFNQFSFNNGNNGGNGGNINQPANNNQKFSSYSSNSILSPQTSGSLKINPKSTTSKLPPQSSSKQSAQSNGSGSNEYKVVVAGGGGVGKSALTIMFVQNHFIESYDPTIEDSYRKQITVDGRDCFLSILDTAGQEEYSAMRDQYMRTGQGFILVFSLVDRVSLEQVSTLYEYIGDLKEQKGIPTVLVGNKCDLVNDRVIPTSEGEDLAVRLGVVYFETSAKNQIHVDDVFVSIVREIRKTEKPTNHTHTKCSIL